MFTRLKKWIDYRKAMRSYAAYERGYNYAAGQLLMHGLAIEQDLLNQSTNPFEMTSFDAGMGAAIRDYNELRSRITAGLQ